MTFWKVAPGARASDARYPIVNATAKNQSRVFTIALPIVSGSAHRISMPRHLASLCLNSSEVASCPLAANGNIY